jgi:hypothetical protein
MVSENVKKVFNAVAREAFMPREVLEEMNAFDKCSPLARERGERPAYQGTELEAGKIGKGGRKEKAGDS